MYSCAKVLEAAKRSVPVAVACPSPSAARAASSWARISRANGRRQAFKVVADEIAAEIRMVHLGDLPEELRQRHAGLAPKHLKPFAGFAR